MDSHPAYMTGGGYSVMLFSSTGEVMAATSDITDANTYRPFKAMDTTVMASLAERLESYDDTAAEGTHH